MQPSQARLFLEGVLLDIIREDIRLTYVGARKTESHKDLDARRHEAIRGTLYDREPAAASKRVFFPLLNVSSPHYSHASC